MCCRFRLSSLLLAALLLAACGARSPAPGAAPAAAPAPAPAAGAPVVSPLPPATVERVILYFPHRSRPGLVREERRAQRHGEQPEFFALRQLLAGPQSADARPVLPDPGGWADQAAIAAKVLEGDVDLVITRAAADALRQSGDRLAVYAVVDTLATFPRVRSVRFIIEGAGSRPLVVDGLDLSQPLTPRWDLVLS